MPTILAKVIVRIVLFCKQLLLILVKNHHQHKLLIIPEITASPWFYPEDPAPGEQLAIPGCWITQKHPQSLSSEAIGTLTSPHRHLGLITPSSPLLFHQNPIVESKDQHQCFLLFFLHTLSVLVLGSSKPRSICNQGPLRVLERRGSGEPNTNWAQTLNITLFTRRPVSFILWKQATLQNPLSHSLPVSTEERA